MKKVVFVILSMWLSCQLHAQEKVDMFEFLSQFEKQITIQDFKEKYSDSLHPFNEEIKVVNEAGVFFTELFSYNGNPSMQLVTISKGSGAITMCVAPDADKIAPQAFSLASADLKTYIVSHLGEPIIEDEDISGSESLLGLFAKEGIDSGKRYIWNPEVSDVGYMGFSIVSKGTDFFILMILPASGENQASETNPGFAETPIQNKFFYHIELSKHLPVDLLGTELNVSRNEIKVTKTSEGHIYQVLYKGYFGGRLWDLIEMKTVDGMLSDITFVCSMTSDNRHIYEDLLKALIKKYGEPISFNETTKVWYDIESTRMLCIEYKHIPNMLGEMRYYVNLSYSDSALIRAGAEKAANEL